MKNQFILKFILCFLIVFIILALPSCKSNKDDQNSNDACSELQKHIYYYEANENTHVKVCTCGEELNEAPKEHTDTNNDNECDVCSHLMSGISDEFTVCTYYLPYQSATDPISLMFDENKKCKADFLDNSNHKYYCNYYLRGDYVHLDIATDAKYHVFKITEYGLVLDKQQTTANLWDSYSYSKPVIYYYPGVSIPTILSTTVMADRELDYRPQIDKIYGKYEIKMSDNTTMEATVFSVYAKDDNSPWVDKVIGTECTFTYPDGREILIYTYGTLYTLTEAYDRGYVSLEIIEYMNTEFRDCNISHSYDDGVINSTKSIKYTCKACGDTKFVDLPDDFSFSLTFGFDGKYDSKTGELRNGYNYELDSDCVTTLTFNKKELMNIYRILYNGGYWNINGDMKVSNSIPEPSYNIKISITVNGQTTEAKIRGASYISYSEWLIYPEFGYAYDKIVNEFIKNSEEFKALPHNDNVYD